MIPGDRFRRPPLCLGNRAAVQHPGKYPPCSWLRTACQVHQRIGHRLDRSPGCWAHARSKEKIHRLSPVSPGQERSKLFADFVTESWPQGRGGRV